jgi:hypothetical protein
MTGENIWLRILLIYGGRNLCIATSLIWRLLQNQVCSVTYFFYWELGQNIHISFLRLATNIIEYAMRQKSERIPFDPNSVLLVWIAFNFIRFLVLIFRNCLSMQIAYLNWYFHIGAFCFETKNVRSSDDSSYFLLNYCLKCVLSSSTIYLRCPHGVRILVLGRWLGRMDKLFALDWQNMWIVFIVW